MDKTIALWIAQGFGVGRIPFAPGTFGSIAGIAWFALLVALPFPIAISGTLIGVGLSVWSAGVAEKILGERDPGSVVVDEIVAIPLCFAGWVCIEVAQGGGWPSLDRFFVGPGLWRTCGLFAGFRLFDIWKPWPVASSQSLPAGWGITVDDLLAAGYTNICFLGVHWAFKLT